MFWVKADAITGLSDGSLVSNWADQSGNGYNATQSNSSLQPTYHVNVLNGLPGVQWPGSGYTGILLKTTTFSFNQPTTTYVVGKGTNSGYMQYFTDGAATGDTMGMRINYLNWPQLGLDGGNGGSGAQGFFCGAPDLSQFRIMGGLFSGSSSTLRIDGNATCGGTIGVANVGGIELGNGYSGGRGLNGYITEVVVYSGALTTTQEQLVEGYLAWKWGLQANLPSGHPWNSSAPNWTPASSCWSASCSVRRGVSSVWR